MLKRAAGFALGFVVLVVAGLALSACAPRQSLLAEPAVIAAQGYAQALEQVLSGGDIAALEPYASVDQVDRVRRYRMMLEGERGQVLAAELVYWRAIAIESRSDAALVSAEEKWVTQPIDVRSGQPVGEVESRRVVAVYELVLDGDAWRVSNLTDRPAGEE